MNAPTITACALVTLGPAMLTLVVAAALGADPQVARLACLLAGAFAFATGLVQHRLIGAGVATVLGAQLLALLLRLALAAIVLVAADAVGLGGSFVLCLVLPLALAVVGDAALLARASARLDMPVKEPLGA